MRLWPWAHKNVIKFMKVGIHGVSAISWQIPMCDFFTSQSIMRYLVSVATEANISHLVSDM